MSDRSEAIGFASARRLSPPPKSFASALAMKDQVTASTRPRAASSRFASRVRFWIGVRIGRTTASSSRRSGCGAMRSSPTMRIDLLDEVGLALDVRAP